MTDPYTGPIPVTPPPSLWPRLVGFLLLPAIAAVSPLLVLPIVSRTAGPGGWASAIAGESVGTVAAIAIGYGWATVGPALISVARDDDVRAALYRESLALRSAIAIVALPVMAVICWLVASPGAEWLAVLMGAQGALIAMSFTWYCAGIGEPRSIVVYDAIPRLVAAVASAVIISQSGFVELYPMAGIAVTLVGTALYTRRILGAHPGPWPGLRDLPRLLRAGAPVASTDVALSAYSSIPTPLVTVTSPATVAAGFASGDKMLKLGQFLPVTLANALQRWIAEAHGPGRARRMRIAMLWQGGFGALGAVVLATFGSWASLVLFGAQAQAQVGVLVALGCVFFFFSLRTSISRHVLFPSGEATAVMRATLVGSAIGVPVMIVLALTIGPIGAAIGYAVTEGAATVLLIPRCRRALQALDRMPPTA